MLCLEFVPGVAEMVSKDETHELWRPPKYKKITLPSRQSHIQNYSMLK